jgi:large subunit ribosomal protein L30
MAELTITQTKSLIGANPKAAASVRSLGLGRIHQSVTRDDGPQVRGYLQAARHLVTVEACHGAAESPGKKSTSK